MSRINRKNCQPRNTKTTQATSVPARPKSLPEYLEILGLSPDPVQLDILREDPHRCVINCTRQWGKSTVTAVKAVHQATTKPGSLTLVLSPSARQSGEFLRKSSGFLSKLDIPTKSDGHNELSLLLPNRSRIVGLPANEDTTRGFSSTDLLIVDEASRVSDRLYHAVRPTLAASNGQLWIISTPAGRRGFYQACTSQSDHWRKIEIPATRCTRISAAFLEEERHTHSDHMFRQEYLCEFLDSDDAVFPTTILDSAFIDIPPFPICPELRSAPEIPDPEPFHYYNEPTFFIAVDLGQVNDYTAIAVLELATVITGARNGWDFAYPTAKRYTIRHLERLKLRTSYTDVVRHVCSLLRHPSLHGTRRLLVDATGGGRPVIDIFKEARPDARLYPITITGGDTPSTNGSEHRVPRNDLLTALEIGLQSGNLKISKHLPTAEALRHELSNLRRLVPSNGEAFIDQSSSRIHDDLVFAIAMANWKAVQRV